MLRFLLCLCACGSFCASRGQTGALWEGATRAQGHGKAAVARKVSGFKAWKRQLQEWGTDTSYRREAGVLGRLHSDGWALGLYGARKSEDGRTLHALQLHFSEVLHEKQVKQQAENSQFPALGQGAPYVYGKTANLYLLSLLYTQDRMLLPGVLEGSVSVGWRWGAGPVLALLKPYHLELLQIDYGSTPATATIRNEAYTDASAEAFLNRSRIFGAGRWADGLDGIRYVPGLQAEVALTVAPVQARVLVPKLALGVGGSLYARSLPVMAARPAYPWQLRLFASLQLGKRW